MERGTPKNMNIDGLVIICFQFKWALKGVSSKLVLSPPFPFIKSDLNPVLVYVFDPVKKVCTFCLRGIVFETVVFVA